MLRFVALIEMFCLSVASAGQTEVAIAQAYLGKSLNDPAMAEAVLGALLSTNDKDLVPIFAAACRSGDKGRRLFAVQALGELAGKDAATTLLERVRKDPQMATRAVALAELMGLEAISAEQLAQALKVPDENVQCLAARGLVRLGQSELAMSTLRKLVLSKDLVTSCLVRMSLLGLGRGEHIVPLRKVLGDPTTRPEVVALLMDQIAEDEITAAAELAQMVVASDRSDAVKLRAYRAVSAVSRRGGEMVRRAIKKSSSTVYRLQLLRILATRPDARADLESLGKGKDVVGALARLELARQGGGETLGRCVQDAMQFGHPVVVEYVLDVAKKDIRAKKPQARLYAPALLGCIQSLPREASALSSEHVRAARAATLLADLGSMAGLKKVLDGPYGPAKRAVVTGLLRTKNPAACDLAEPLLSSTYWQLASAAALVLGRFAEPAATMRLQEILHDYPKHPPALVVLAGWYLLKIEGESAPSAKILADLIE